MKPKSPAEIAARWVLAIVTLLLLASMGGGFVVVPLLIPAHVWAARRSGGVGRIGWSLLPGLGAAVVVWAATYSIAGEAQPAIWALPTAALAAAALAVFRFARPAVATRPVRTN